MAKTKLPVHELLRGAIVLFFALLWFAAYRTVEPRYSGDEEVWAYNGVASFTKMLLGNRPFLVPLVHRWFGFEEQLIVWFQAASTVLSAAYLASSIAQFLKRPWARTALFGVSYLYLLLDPNPWSFTIRSEALSHVALFTFLGATLNLSQSASAGTFSFVSAFIVGISAVALVGTRDTGSYLLLLSLPFLAYLAWFGNAPRAPMLFLGLWLLLVGIGSERSALLAHRHLSPTINVVLNEGLNNPTMRDHLTNERGMPLSRDLLKLRGKSASAHEWAVMKNRPFIDWVVKDGRGAIGSYLVRHPVWAIDKAASRFNAIVREDHRSGYLARASTRAVESVARGTRVFAPQRAFPRVFWVGCLGCLLLVGRRTLRAPVRFLALWTLWCALAAGLVAFLSVHGDAIEVLRHGAAAGPLLDVALLLLVALGCAVLENRANGSAPSERATEPPSRRRGPTRAALGVVLVGATVLLFAGTFAYRSKRVGMSSLSTFSSPTLGASSFEHLKNGDLTDSGICLAEGEFFEVRATSKKGFRRALFFTPSAKAQKFSVEMVSAKKSHREVVSRRRKLHVEKDDRYRPFRRILVTSLGPSACFSELIFN